MRTRFVIGLSLLIALLSTPQVRAQECPLGWAAGPLQADLRGADGPVHAMVLYDPPGAPPQQLIVGGEFTHIGSIAANNVAAWDGNIWRPLDSGTDGPVRALAVHNNNLIAVGNFNEAGGLGPFSRYVAAWNGSAWFTLAPIPLGYIELEPDDYRYASTVAVFNDQLIVGGRIKVAPGDDSYLFRLNGTTWEDVAHPEAFEPPRFLQVFDEDGAGPVIPLLYCDCIHVVTAEDDYSFIQRWNGTIWGNLWPHPTSFVYASTITNEGLVLGGDMTSIYHGDFEWDEGYNGVVRWTGEDWYRYGEQGITVDYYTGERVTAVRQYGNDLYAAGRFSEAGGQPCSNMARWDGSNWFGTAGVLFSGDGYQDIHEMRVHAGDLIVGGEFNLSDPSAGEVNNLARFDGSFWKAFTMPVRVNALGTVGSQLVMGGSFIHTYNASQGLNTRHLATWNGWDVAPLDGDVNAPVHAIESFTVNFTNKLVVGGEFTQVGTEEVIDPGVAGVAAIPANRIALWNGLIINGGWSAMGDGFNGTVLAVERVAANQFFGDTIYAGGEFTASGSGSPAFNRIAEWGGSPASWLALGTGFNNTVRALKGYNSGPVARHVIAGGDFTTASGVAANHIAIWSSPAVPPQTWLAMGSGFNAPVLAIERHNGSTYAAGEFTASGATPISHVARWTGTTWESVGNGINGNVYALKSHDGKLYAAGGLSFLVWDGTTWAAVDGALTLGSGRAIQPFKTEIEVGGDFIAADGGEVETSGLARYRYQGLPWIVRQPLAQTAHCHFDIVDFHVDVAAGYDDVATYQWHKDGVPLTEGWTGTGSYRQGTNTTDLRVRDPSDVDEGAYKLVITTSCGTVTSTAVTLDVTDTCPPCPLDFAPPLVGDGVVGIDEVLGIVNMWGACPPPSPAGCTPDVEPPGGNGVVDIDDLLAVINAWSQTCP